LISLNSRGFKISKYNLITTKDLIVLLIIFKKF
jgi:hypothetical protein